VVAAGAAIAASAAIAAIGRGCIHRADRKRRKKRERSEFAHDLPHDIFSFRLNWV
jgi:hypothetical protein